jgi:hypothetical protein
MEHSAYVSDGSDNYVIRRNVFFGSNVSGLQCNLDTGQFIVAMGVGAQRCAITSSSTGKPFSIEIDNTSIYRLDSSYGVINTRGPHQHSGRTEEPGRHPARRLEDHLRNYPGTGSKSARPFECRAMGHYRRQVVEAQSNRPDFRQKHDSKLFTRWGYAVELPREDLSGRPRFTPSIGAFVPASQ